MEKQVTETQKRVSKWFSGMDSLRFVLALVVLLGHLENPLADTLKSAESSLQRYLGSLLSISFIGVVAVICFFIISGFVIHYPNRAGISNLKNFYYRRYIRVLVPLLVITVISIPLGNPEQAVVWSLYCELIFYTIYPFLAAIKSSWRSKVIVSFFLAGIVILVGAFDDIASLLNRKNLEYDGSYWQLGIGLTWVIGLPCWLLGVQLADRIDSVKTIVSRSKIYLLRILVFLSSIALMLAQFHFLVTYLVSLTLFSIPFCKWIEYEIQYYKRNEPVKLLESWGKFSYSLYLTHPLAIVVIPYFIPLTSFSYIFIVALSILFAFVFYLLLERPSHLLAQRMSRKKLVVKPSPVLVE